MEDLNLGDAHLVCIRAANDGASVSAGSAAADATPHAGSSALYVCLCVVQKRTAKGVSKIQLDALSEALKKIRQISVDLVRRAQWHRAVVGHAHKPEVAVSSLQGLTVHMPRIGAGTPSFNWYERKLLIVVVMLVILLALRFGCAAGILSSDWCIAMSHQKWTLSCIIILDLIAEPLCLRPRRVLR